MFLSGVLFYKQLFDRVYRHLIIEGLSVEAAKSAIESLKNMLQGKVEELSIRDDDVVSVEIEYEITDSEVSWREETLKITLYKPLEEFKEILRERDRLLSENRELQSKIESLRKRLEEIRDLVSRVLEEV